MTLASHDDFDWRYLSSVERKREIYSRDPYFREAMHDVLQTLGPGAYDFLHLLALLVVKPEGLAGRRVDALSTFVDEHDFAPVWFSDFAYTRHTIRALWSYQWNAASLDKMDLSDRINTAHPTLLTLLRDDGQPRRLPATVRLKSLKGAAAPEAREGVNLRNALDSPNRMLSVVHTADEPADLVRELGIFFDRPTRRAILQELSQDVRSVNATNSWRQALKSCEAATPETDLDADAAWARLLERASGAVAERVRAQHDLYRHRGLLDWEELTAACEEGGLPLWDLIAVRAAAVEHQDSGYEPLITFGNDDVRAWLGGAAALSSPRPG